MMRLAVLLLFAPLLAGGEIVEGTVTHKESPLPGCTVTLASGTVSGVTVSDGNGRYSFRYVPAGTYDLTIELPGFKIATRRVDVMKHTVVAPIELVVDDVSVVTVSCVLGRPCSDKPPMSRWQLPWCMHVQTNDDLIESLERGNRGAIEILRWRYETAFTYREKHSIAAALLGRLPDDSAIRKELEDEAAICLRFPRVDGKYSDAFEEYCRERNLNPDDVWNSSRDALRVLEASGPR